jgi:hypothetical protein
MAGGPARLMACAACAGQRMPSSNSAGEESSSPRARITIVSSRGERLQRSSRLISVRWRSHMSASASWDSPTRARWRRRFAANCSRASSMPTLLLDADGRSTDRCLRSAGLSPALQGLSVVYPYHRRWLSHALLGQPPVVAWRLRGSTAGLNRALLNSCGEAWAHHAARVVPKG